MTTNIGGQKVSLTQDTQYPFRETVTIRVETEQPIRFPLHLRIPGWAKGASVTLPDGTQPEITCGEYLIVDRTWNGGEEVTLHFPMAITAKRGFNGSVAIQRGPLVYSLKIGDQWVLVDGTDPYGDYEVHPTTPWNYGLLVDLESPDSSFEVRLKPVGDMPFSPEGAPVELVAQGKRIPQWQLVNGSAGPIPQSPVSSDAPTETIILIPYGCTNLRITEFPLVK